MILPPPPAGGQVYRKVRDRASYDFALVSVAALVDLTADDPLGTHRAGRRGAQAVARAEAERQLAGVPMSDDAFAAAGEAAVKGAQGRGHNDFKIALAARAVAVRCRRRAAEDLTCPTRSSASRSTVSTARRR